MRKYRTMDTAQRLQQIANTATTIKAPAEQTGSSAEKLHLALQRLQTRTTDAAAAVGIEFRVPTKDVLIWLRERI